MGKIYLCSFGLRLNDITIATIEVLRDCGIIFLQAFDSGIEEFLKQRGVRGKFVRIKHPENGDFSGAAEKIIQASDAHKTAVISYGFPTFINGLYEELKNKCGGKTALETVYSVGSINAVLDMADISDIGQEGLHFFNGVNPKCLETIELKKHLPCLIFNAHAFLRTNLRRKFLLFFKKMSGKGCAFFAIEAPSAGAREAVNMKIDSASAAGLKFLNDRTTLFIKKENKKRPL